MSDAPILLPDLVVEILSWLPVKALMRFKCISKTWNSLMFDPTFIKLHLQRTQKNTHLLFMIRDGQIISRLEDALLYTEPCSIQSLLENPSSIIDLNNCPKIIGNYCVCGVCNGLVGIFSFDCEMGFQKGFVEYWFRFWNPATRVMSSQDSPHIRLHPSNYEVGPPFYTGIGYDDWNDTYKVVLVLLDIKSQQKEVRVYTLGGTCWKKILTCPAFPFFREFGESLNGTINWIAIRNLNLNTPFYNWETITINDIVIFSYDLKNETYKLLLMPVGLSEVPSEPPECGVLKGCLCLYHVHKGTHFVVWLMMELGVENSWTQLLNVCFEHLQTQIHDMSLPKFEPMCMSENEDVLLLAVDGQSEFILYNRRDSRIECTGDLNYRKYYSISAFDHVQSLVLPY